MKTSVQRLATTILMALTVVLILVSVSAASAVWGN